MGTKGYKTRKSIPADELYKTITQSNKELLLRYINSEPCKKLSQKTRKIYEGVLLNFMLYLDKDLPLAKSNEINNFIEIERNRVGANRIRVELAAFRGLFNYCIAEGLIEISPMVGITSPKKENKALIETKKLKHDQIAKIYDLINNPKNKVVKKFSIFWYLVYEQGIQKAKVTKCSSENFDSSIGVFKLGKSIINLDERNTKLMVELKEEGNSFAFGEHVIEKYLMQIGSIVGVKDLNFRDVVHSRKKNYVECPDCGRELENIKGNWVFLYGRLACIDCANGMM